MDFYSSSSLNFLRMYLSIGTFLQVFVEITKLEAHSHGLLNVSKKDSANTHVLVTKVIFNSSLLFSKKKILDKMSVLE